MGRQAQMIATAGSVMFQIIGLIAVSISNNVSKPQAGDNEQRTCKVLSDVFEAWYSDDAHDNTT